MDRTYGPFEVEAINQALTPEGLVYGAGYSMYMKPSFFLAELSSTRQMDGLIGHDLRELNSCRDLLTSPAMLQGSSVFLRLEPLMMLLHFKFGELNTKSDPLLEEAFSHYGFRERQLVDETFEKRLQALAEAYAEIIVAHEVGEHREGVPEWKDILTAAGDRKNEHYLRAIKDLLADTSEAGPLRKIIETRDRGALGLWTALMEGFPRVMFPEIRQAVKEFRNYGNWDVIEKTRRGGYERFRLSGSGCWSCSGKREGWVCESVEGKFSGLGGYPAPSTASGSCRPSWRNRAPCPPYPAARSRSQRRGDRCKRRR